jgi:uncharacterized membrane protein YcfT
MSQDVTQASDEASRNEAWRGLRARFRAGEDAGGNVPAPASVPSSAADRVVWFDYAKGICIILVVMMHSTLGVGDAFGAEGFMHWVVAFAKPFRMPDFFLLSGLFLFRVIDRDWRTYLDRKVVHFAYFYLLWLAILIAVKQGAALGADPQAWLGAFADNIANPNPNLWFIYVLPLFFVVTKLARATGVPNWALWLGAAALQTFPVHTGWEAIDHYGAQYFVFFLSGYMLAPRIFKLAEWTRENAGLTLALLSGWFIFNMGIAFEPSHLAGIDTIADVPGLRIAFGLIGAVAIVSLAAVLSRLDAARFIRYAGQNSIVLYVSFVLPMAATRILLLKTGLIQDVGVVSLIVTSVAVAAPLILHAMVRGTWARFLYERPETFKIERREAPAPAESPVAPPQTRLHGPIAVPTSGRG